MKWFRNYEECEQITRTFMDSFSELSQTRMEQSYNAAGQYHDEYSKIWRVMQTFQKCLWEIEEAVENGFHKWMKTNFELRKEAIEYHNSNGNDFYGKNKKIEQISEA